MSSNDSKFMSKCFELALKGAGFVSPNPLVGSVIVKDKKVIAEGFHKKVGHAHAELDAINNATESIKGATLYCNLEPCCHTNKRTPPCAQRIVSEGIKRVVIANLDPNPLVAGNGVKILEEAGIEVLTGVLKEKGELLNEIFFKHIVENKPFIQIKYAQTLDGFIAATDKSSKWITGEVAREHVHLERLKYDAILVGAQTIRDDNPSLTTRVTDKEIHCSKRVILTRNGDLPKESKIFKDEFSENTIIIHNDHSIEENINLLFTEYNIKSIYVEGGAQILSELFNKNLYDRISVYTAPKFLGNGIRPITNNNTNISQAKVLQNAKVINLGEDFLITARNK